MEEKYIKLKEAIKYSMLCRSTLHKYDKQGLLVPLRTPSGHRRYTKKQIDDFLSIYKK
ncbi:MAG: MerR family DNA-binding transcriptional regulator, partial [Fusobacteriaceae bacterium]